MIEQKTYRSTSFAAVIILAAVTAVTLVIFRTYPEIDTVISQWFFTSGECWQDQKPPNCGRFTLLHDTDWRDFRSFGYRLPTSFGLVMVFYLLILLSRKIPASNSELSKPIISLLVLLVGPILLVNLILKELWGRPRPYQTEQFGGEFPYVSPGTITDFCQSNCSFVSGEASAAFWMMTFILFVPGIWRWVFGIGIAALSTGISLLRVSFGRHYISDVIMSALFTLLIFAIIYLIVQSRWSQWVIECLVERVNFVVRRIRYAVKCRMRQFIR